MRQIRGKWGGLSARMISDLIGINYHTCRKMLADKEKELGRLLETAEVGEFIVEKKTSMDLKLFKRINFNWL